MDWLSVAAFLISWGSLAYAIYSGRMSEVTSVMPIVVFVFDRDAGWQIRNIGNGPAMNIIVARKNHSVAEGGGWFDPIQVPPLKADGIFGIHWAVDDNEHGFGATYEDVWRRRYRTICGRDQNEIKRNRSLRDWGEQLPTAEWLKRSEARSD